MRNKEKIVYMSSWGNKKNRNWLKVGKTFRRMQHRLRLHIRLGLVQQVAGHHELTQSHGEEVKGSLLPPSSHRWVSVLCIEQSTCPRCGETK